MLFVYLLQAIQDEGAFFLEWNIKGFLLKMAAKKKKKKLPLDIDDTIKVGL